MTRMGESTRDVVIVGAGPNGLTAAAVLARSGLSVLVLERADRIGGGCRTEAVTEPGFQHDLCSAIHPMGAASPIFDRLALGQFGLTWLTAPFAVAHPLDSGEAALLSTGFEATRASLGRDAARWERLVAPFVRRRDAFFNGILQPIRWPRHPFLMAAFGRHALLSSTALARRFDGHAARALLAGNAAHSLLPLDATASAAFGLALAIAGHTVDWPCAEGGSAQIAEALAACARASGCEIRTGVDVTSLADVPEARAVLFDLTPRQVTTIAAGDLPPSYVDALSRFRYGPGVFKIDYALREPIPWRPSECRDASTVHVGGTIEEIARSEADVHAGRTPERPFVLVSQQSRMDRSRAPAGAATGWAYCHVPAGASVDMTDRIESQIERFAPGFRDVVIARHVSPPAALEARNPNLVGGDVGGGSNELGQVLFRPVTRWDPYATPNPRLFLCSSSTPPGGGVHGMCGYWAARSVLRRRFGRAVAPGLDINSPERHGGK